MTLRGRPSHGDGILRNRHYVGELVWNRRHLVVDPKSGQAHRRLNPGQASVVGLVPELRIIDDELQAAAQAQFAASAAPQDPETVRQRFWEKRRQRHLLSGKVICGTCDGPISVHRAREYRCNGAARGLCDNRVAIKREVLEVRVLAILAEPMMDPELAEAFAAEFTAEWNRLAGHHAAAEGQVRRGLDAVERKLGNLLYAAEGIRGAGLQAKLSAAEAEVEGLRRSLAEAKPTPVRLLPNLGDAYGRTVARLREALNEGNNPEAADAARALIDRVIIHPTPRGTPPRITVEGHSAQMLTTAQPDLPTRAANAIAEAAELAVKVEPGAAPPALLAFTPPARLR
jgi:site-specific DNA recombinase